jgi:hypothetical protein
MNRIREVQRDSHGASKKKKPTTSSAWNGSSYSYLVYSQLRIIFSSYITNVLCFASNV